MSIEMTVSEIAEVLGLSRQAINNRVKELPEEDTDKNDKGVTVVTRSGLIKLEEIYKKTIFEDEPVSEDVKQRELMEILVDEKNAEILRLYEQLKAKDRQLSEKDRQIAEKDKQLDQQQQLTLQAMKDQENLKLELDQAKEEVQSTKKGFFARLFGG
ncbi:TPA: chromosome segregation protein RocS [Streptococcus pneumoniae]|nr:chromosome segregation protein RocS [Streptococcus pneumoniae]HEV0573501.1 chromosome segregation protein RocS [Streptococcus pneumoniae]